MGILRKLSGGALWTIGARAAFALSGLIVNALLARHMPEGQFGAYLLCVSLVGFLVLIAQMGLQISVVRNVAAASGEGQREAAAAVALTSAGLSAGAAVLIGLGYATFGESLLVPSLGAGSLAGHALPVVLWLVLTAPLGVLAEALRGYQEFARASVLSGLSANLLLLACVAVLVYASVAIQIDTVLFACSAAAGISLALGLTWVVPRVGELRGRWLQLTGPTRLLVSSFPLLITALATFATTQADLWVAGATLGEKDAGVYGAAVRLVQLVLVPLLVINSVIAPAIAEFHAARDTSRLERLLSGAAFAAALPAVIMLGMLTLFAEEIIRAVYGSGFERGAFCLIAVSAGQLVNTLCGPAAVTLMMSEHGRSVMWVSLLSAAITGGGGLLLAGTHGLFGIAVASAIGTAMHGLACAVQVRRVFGIWSFPRPTYLRSALARFRT